MLFACVQILHFCITSFFPQCCEASFYSHHLCVCCCGRISPSQSLLYLEAEPYQSLQLAACDSILTDLQRSNQSPLFLSRSFFLPISTTHPLSFSHATLTVLYFLFSPFGSTLLSFHLFFFRPQVLYHIHPYTLLSSFFFLFVSSYTLISLFHRSLFYTIHYCHFLLHLCHFLSQVLHITAFSLFFFHFDPFFSLYSSI